MKFTVASGNPSDEEVLALHAVLANRKPVDLKPGSYHIMLMDLKLPLNKDVSVPLTLTIQDVAGKKSQQTVQVPVSTSSPAGQGMGMHQGGEHKH